jgi:hypothetical protein
MPVMGMVVGGMVLLVLGAVAWYVSQPQCQLGNFSKKLGPVLYNLAAPNYCAVSGWNHRSDNLPGGGPTMADCVKGCNKNTNCNGFIWWGEKNGCYLRDFSSAGSAASGAYKQAGFDLYLKKMKNVG